MELNNVEGINVADVVMLQNVTSDWRRLNNLLKQTAIFSCFVIIAIFIFFYKRLDDTDQTLSKTRKRLLEFERDKSRLVLNDALRG